MLTMVNPYYANTIAGQCYMERDLQRQAGSEKLNVTSPTSKVGIINYTAVLQAQHTGRAHRQQTRHARKPPRACSKDAQKRGANNKITRPPSLPFQLNVPQRKKTKTDRTVVEVHVLVFIRILLCTLQSTKISLAALSHTSSKIGTA